MGTHSVNDLIQRLTNAIIRQEGMPADYHNPGNLRDCPWFALKQTAMPRSATNVRTYSDGTEVTFKNGFWVPRTRPEGVAGAAHVVALRVAMGQSLRQLISAWAPPSDGNNTEKYISNVAAWAGIPSVDQPLCDLIEDPRVS